MMRKTVIILSILVLSINSYGQNWADSIFYSTIRPNKELQLHSLYTDTLEYIEYDDHYDDFFFLVQKDDETFGQLICNDIHRIVSNLNLNYGDIIAVQWVIDSLRPEGDKELYFREYALEVAKIKDGEKETLPTGEMVRKKIVIPLLNDKLVISEGREFPCIVHELQNYSSYFEIKRRDGKYVIRGNKYDTINEGVEDYLKNDFFKHFYTNEERWEQVWGLFVRDGGLQKVIDFINEVIDDEFLDSPFNTIYG